MRLSIVCACVALIKILSHPSPEIRCYVQRSPLHWLVDHTRYCAIITMCLSTWGTRPEKGLWFRMSHFSSLLAAGASKVSRRGLLENAPNCLPLILNGRTQSKPLHVSSSLSLNPNPPLLSLSQRAISQPNMRDKLWGIGNLNCHMLPTNWTTVTIRL